MTAPRIDAHQHSGGTTPAEYGWIDDAMAPLRRDFLPADASGEMRAAGFDACVAVQARQTVDETRWLLALADRHPFIAGVVGWVDLQSADVDAQLEAVAAHPKLVGVRHIVQAEPDDFLARPAFRRGIARLEHFGLAYDILVYARQLPARDRVCRGLPGGSGSCSIISGSRTSRRRHSTSGGGSRSARRAAERVRQAVGAGDGGGLARLDAGALRPYIDAAFDASARSG